jgi:hypothetical protein
VFARGDAWYRTGDLMRRDAGGFFYFVDRFGDTFRWKGENVATAEVAAAITAFPGIVEANVYGVRVPGSDGAAGMAAVVVNGALDLPELRAHLARRLPPYARPLFLRIVKEMISSATATIPQQATRSISMIPSGRLSCRSTARSIGALLPARYEPDSQRAQIFVGWAKAPTGPARSGRPDDKLRAVPTYRLTIVPRGLRCAPPTLPGLRSANGAWLSAPRRSQFASSNKFVLAAP